MIPEPQSHINDFKPRCEGCGKKVNQGVYGSYGHTRLKFNNNKSLCKDCIIALSEKRRAPNETDIEYQRQLRLGITGK